MLEIINKTVLNKGFLSPMLRARMLIKIVNISILFYYFVFCRNKNLKYIFY